MSDWKRRDFLKAAGIVSAASAMPTLLPMTRAEAATGDPRLVLIGNAQGTDMGTWSPSGGADLELSYQLEPLAEYRDELLVLDGVFNVGAVRNGSDGSRANGGHEGVCSLFTGAAATSSTKGGAASVDEIVGQELRARALAAGAEPARFPVLRIGRPAKVASPSPDAPGSRRAHDGFFWLERNVSAPLLWGPWEAYSQIFADISGGEEGIAQLRAERRSVLDGLRFEIARIRGELPEIERDHLDRHLTGIRKIEEDLDRVSFCAPPDLGMAAPHSSMGLWSDGDQQDIVAKMTFRLMAAALSCGLTNVACFSWHGQEGVADVLKHVPEYSDTYGGMAQLDLHSQAHHMNTDALTGTAREVFADLNRWRAQKVKEDLLDNLAGDVLDHTTMAWSSEMSEGGTHSNYNIPLVVFQGREVGHFRTGHHFTAGDYHPIYNSRPRSNPGEPMTKVLVSLCHSMGLTDIDSVGDAGYSTGPLTEAML